MLRALLLLCVLLVLSAQELADEAVASVQDPLQARLAAARFDREHRLYEREKIRKEELRKAQDELEKRAEEGLAGDYGYDDYEYDYDYDDEKLSTSNHLGGLKRQDGQTKVKSSVLFASLERSYMLPPEAGSSSALFFLPDPTYSIGAKKVIHVPTRLATDEVVNATMRSHGCTPRRAMEMKAARGEAEERQDAARAREEKLRRLKGEAIRESYLEGKKLARDNKRTARAASKTQRAVRDAAKEVLVRRQQNSPEEKERQRVEQLKRLVLIDARFGTVGQVSSDNDPEKRRGREREEAEAEEALQAEEEANDPITLELFTDRSPEEPVAFRDRAAAEGRARGEAAARREAETPTAPLGAPCEAQLCGACKALVEEFSDLLQLQQRPRAGRAVYVAPLLDEAFCASMGVAAKYTPIVSEMCAQLLLPGTGNRPTGFRDVFVWGFVGDHTAGSAASAFARKEQVCSAIGACLPSDFSYEQLLANVSAADSSSSSSGVGGQLRCMVCERFAEEVQERVSLLSAEALDAFLAPAVTGACERLQLPARLDAECSAVLSGRGRVQAEVFVRALRERMQRQERDELGFARRLCADLRQCARGGGSGGAAADEERKRVETEMMRNAVYF